MTLDDLAPGCDHARAGRSVDPAVREAIAWMVNLQSGEATQEERNDFEQWYGDNPANAAAWSRLSGSLGPLHILSEDRVAAQGAVTRRILDRHTSRRRLLQVGAVGAASFAILSGADRLFPLPELLAQHVTWTGQRTTLALDQGAELTLGPRSAVNIVKLADHDRIELVSGQVLLDVRETPRKLLRLAVGDWSVAPEGGRVTALTRGAIRSVSAIDKPMTIDIAKSGTRALTGGQTLLSDNGMLRLEAADAEVETAWTRGLLVVRDRLLSDVVDSVRPSYVGVIRVTAEAARLRIGGVYLLNDPVQMFSVMAETVALHVREITPFWISLDVTSA